MKEQESREAIEAPLKREIRDLEYDLESSKRRLEDADDKIEKLEAETVQKESDKEYLNHLLDESYRLWKVDNNERGKWGTLTISFLFMILVYFCDGLAVRLRLTI